MSAMYITGPYEQELGEKMAHLLVGPPGGELRITTLPAMGVVTVVRGALKRHADRFIDIQCGSIGEDEAWPLPVPDGQGGVKYIEVIFPEPEGYEPTDLILVHDISWARYERLTHIKKFVESRQALGARVIIIASPVD